MAERKPATASDGHAQTRVPLVSDERTHDRSIRSTAVVVPQAIQIKTGNTAPSSPWTPFCSTSKAKRVETINYTSADGRRWLQVMANYEVGMAKIWDFDILRFAISKAGEIALQIGYFPSYVDFTAYECLKALGRFVKSGKNHEWLEQALDRLTSTTYKGNFFRENEKCSETFTLINFECVRDEKKRIDKVRVYFNQRIQESAKLRGLLVIDQTVLHEEAGIKKRLLELVAVSKGKESDWTVGLQRLQALCAHEGALKRFKFELKQYELPWKVSFSKAIGGGENVTFTSKPTLVDTAP